MLYKRRFNALLESYIKNSSFHFSFEYFRSFFFAFRHYLHNRRNEKIIFSIINAKKKFVDNIEKKLTKSDHVWPIFKLDFLENEASKIRKNIRFTSWTHRS